MGGMLLAVFAKQIQQPRVLGLQGGDGGGYSCRTTIACDCPGVGGSHRLLGLFLSDHLASHPFPHSNSIIIEEIPLEYQESFLGHIEFP
jgi:hypothetical protein